MGARLTVAADSGSAQHIPGNCRRLPQTTISGFPLTAKARTLRSNALDLCQSRGMVEITMRDPEPLLVLARMTSPVSAEASTGMSLPSRDSGRLHQYRICGFFSPGTGLTWMQTRSGPTGTACGKHSKGSFGATATPL